MKAVRLQQGIMAAVLASAVALTAFRHQAPRRRPDTAHCPPTGPNFIPLPARKRPTCTSTARCTPPAKPSGSAPMWLMPASTSLTRSARCCMSIWCRPSTRWWPVAPCACRAARASGDLDIADSLAAGTYVLRAYTSWMRNAGEEFIYSRRLSIWPASPLGPPDNPVSNASAANAAAKAKNAPSGRPDVQFFPEGGYLVEGLPGVVACKATDASGRGLSVRGQVLNAQNAVVVATFSSRHAGMGRFSFVPGAGQRYHAHFTLPDGTTADYPLPAAAARRLQPARNRNRRRLSGRGPLPGRGRGRCAWPGAAAHAGARRGGLPRPAPHCQRYAGRLAHAQEKLPQRHRAFHAVRRAGHAAVRAAGLRAEWPGCAARNAGSRPAQLRSARAGTAHGARGRCGWPARGRQPLGSRERLPA